MNEFLDDARANMIWASMNLGRDMAPPDLYFSILNYSFGVERLLKAVLYSVNPVFVLEDSSLINAANVLYVDRLTPGMRSKLEADTHKNKGPKANVLTFGASLDAAVQFSVVAQDNQTTFRRLADFRNIIAHQRLSLLNRAEAERFCLKTFHPTVQKFAQEMKFDAAGFFARGAERKLRELNEEIAREDDLRKTFGTLFATHQAIWEKRKDNDAEVTAAREKTEALVGKDRRGGGGSVLFPCPVCPNRAMLFYELDGEYMDGEAVTTGLYASGVRCEFCELTLNESDHYEEMDYLKLNDELFGEIMRATRRTPSLPF